MERQEGRPLNARKGTNAIVARPSSQQDNTVGVVVDGDARGDERRFSTAPAEPRATPSLGNETEITRRYLRPDPIFVCCQPPDL